MFFDEATIIESLVTAYRKAKVDLYRSSDSRLQSLVKYEENLDSNLLRLASLIASDDESWTDDHRFVGGHTFAPESVLPVPRAASEVQWSDPREAWRSTAAGEGTPVAKFRVMSRCSVDMHVLSTLWMLTVGDKFEAVVPVHAMGNRLARERTGRVNELVPATFEHYFGPYRRWRDEGLEAMSTSVRAGGTVIAITADVASFYHRLDPAFLLDDQYVTEVLDVELSPFESRLNRLFVRCLATWSSQVGLDDRWPNRGLPVGLPASAVVANLALVEFDRLAIHEFSPIYYARYVDDVILVLNNEDRHLRDKLEIWQWLANRSGGLLEVQSVEPEPGGISVRFTPDYLAGSDVQFENRKNRIFHLDGDTGESVVGAIRKVIDERSSEWRSFTGIPEDPRRVSREIAVATRDDGDLAATLRDADSLSVRRSAFAIKLRDFEAYERDLDLDSWSAHREAFFDAVRAQILVLPRFFDFHDYVPRLIKLAAACGDSESLRKVFDGLASVVEEVRSTCGIRVKGYSEDETPKVDVVAIWHRTLYRVAVENFASGLHDQMSAESLSDAINALRNLRMRTSRIRPNDGAQRLSRLNRRLHERDLAHIPFRFSLLGPDYVPVRSARGRPRRLPAADLALSNLPVDERLVAGLDLMLVELGADRSSRKPVKGSEVAALVFATRPANALELYLALRRKVDLKNPDPLYDIAGTIHRILEAVRGYMPRPNGVATVRDGSSGYPTIVVDADGHSSNGAVNVALATVHTGTSEWTSAAVGKPDLSSARYERFKRVFNEATSRPVKSDYILLPEFAMPSQWFVSFADKLRLSQTSLISGIEYRSGGPRIVRNQVWAALRSGAPASSAYVVYVQDKQVPAPEEKRLLADLGGYSMEPETRWKAPPVVAHGPFRFGILICSELTNIGHRSELRGRIDALLVPEWNRDLHTFEALVESAALDIHAFIVQANHRSFGDSRIRSPRAREWERDVLRLRGGIHDYVVVGTINYKELRSFQSASHVASGPFKPLPDGFEMADERKTLPLLSRNN